MAADYRVLIDLACLDQFEVSVIDGFIVTWWVDYPVKRVVVVDVRQVKK